MFRKKNKKEVIVDRSAMLRAPAHHPLHFLYALLLGSLLRVRCGSMGSRN